MASFNFGKLNMSSADGTQFNMDALYRIAPSVFTEAADPKTGKVSRKINFEGLRQLLGDNAVDGDGECYQFTWVGKNAAKAEAARPTDNTLRPVPEDSLDWDNTKNVYIEGDNLEVLKLLQRSYLGRVKMIYIDPPYNTGNDFVYDDDFARNADEEDFAAGNVDELGYRYRKNTDSNGKFHSDWCSMIYPRLLVARTLLRENGVIFISIDDHEQENLKKICNEVFGEQNFINCFVWNCSTAGGIRPKFASKTHEYVLCYAKQIDKVDPFFAPLSEGAKKMYTQKDKKGLYRDKDFVFKNKSTNINQKYLIKCPDGEMVKPQDGYIFRFVESRFEEALKEGLVTFKQTNTSPLIKENGEKAHWNIYIKKYLGDALGAPSTLIPKEMMSIYNVGTQCVQALFDGKRVFDNAKPVDVIDYFIKMITKENEIVLDFFSGSATTAHAIMQLNAEDDGNRKFIMVQIPEKTDEDSEAYKAGYKNICEIGKERIRRAGKKIKEESPLTTQNLDTGFRVFRLDESNYEEVSKSPSEYSQETLSLFENNIKADRKDLDLLFGAMLAWGVTLDLPMTTETVDGCTVYTVNEGDLVACFSEGITDKVVAAMAVKMPLRVLFRDTCFTKDAQKINIYEQFKQLMNWTSDEAFKNIRVI